MKPSSWLWTLSLAGASAGLLYGWRSRRRQEADARTLGRSLRRSPAGDVFDPATVDGLPAPAQRYLRHTLAPGTPLFPSVRLSMHGRLRLRPGATPMPMQAEQVLAPPHGLVWRARAGPWWMRIRGFDRYGHGRGTMRWWLYGLIPLVQADGPDVTRSAAGRLGGEAIFVPAMLLPQSGARWEAIDDDTARGTIQVNREAVTFTVAVDAAGRLQRVRLPRWRDDRGDGTPGYDRFVVDHFDRERTFDGVTIPTRFRAGWRLGEPDAFPFFEATLDSARYRPPSAVA